MEVKSDGTEEAMDGKLEIKARPWGMCVMRILPRMDEEWNPMVARLNPAEGFRWGVKEFRLL